MSGESVAASATADAASRGGPPAGAPAEERGRGSTSSVSSEARERFELAAGRLGGRPALAAGDVEDRPRITPRDALIVIRSRPCGRRRC